MMRWGSDTLLLYIHIHYVMQNLWMFPLLVPTDATMHMIRMKNTFQKRKGSDMVPSLVPSDIQCHPWYRLRAPSKHRAQS